MEIEMIGTAASTVIPAAVIGGLTDDVIAGLLGDDDGEVVVVTAEETSEAGKVVGIRKPRMEAFTDRVTGERAVDLLGDDFGPVVAGMTKAPKKVGEKAYNALCYLADRGKLSTFTEASIAALVAGGSLKTADLVTLFKAQDYTDKTARSQAQQQMVVLPILQVATRTGDTLTLNDGHMLNLFKDAAVRVSIPAEKKSKAAKAPKKQKESAETILADSVALVPDETAIKPAHDTAMVEDLLVGMTEAEVVTEDLSAPAPALDLSRMSPEAAIEAMAAAQFAEENKAEEAASTPAKRSRKKGAAKKN